LSEFGKFALDNYPGEKAIPDGSHAVKTIRKPRLNAKGEEVGKFKS